MLEIENGCDQLTIVSERRFGTTYCYVFGLCYARVKNYTAVCMAHFNSRIPVVTSSKFMKLTYIGFLNRKYKIFILFGIT